MSPNTIWSESRWFSTCSAGLPPPRAVDTYPPNSSWPGLTRPSTSFGTTRNKTWMPATSAGMTELGHRASQMAEKPRYYITTAIAYPNGPPHIGYGYEVITTDAIARFKRLDGYDVFFLTGTDEHGIKIAQTATRDGITPKQLVDKNSARFQEMAKLLNASNDQFIRTTEP